MQERRSDRVAGFRAALERAGAPIGPYDVLVAAQARRRDALLVPANQREFAPCAPPIQCKGKRRKTAGSGPDFI
jgi:predicted nucleic acid-binding protein